MDDLIDTLLAIVIVTGLAWGGWLLCEWLWG